VYCKHNKLINKDKKQFAVFVPQHFSKQFFCPLLGRYIYLRSGAVKLYCRALITLLLFALPFATHAKKINCDVLTDVSIISLIAAPKKFEGSCIRARGVLFLDDRSGRLFLNKESLLNWVQTNSIMLVITSEKIRKIQNLDSAYVSITGTFKNNAIGNIIELSEY
jgi:hypothetical protein